MKTIVSVLFLFLSLSSYSQDNIKNSYKTSGYFNITKLGYITVTSLEQDVFIPSEGNIVSSLDTNKANAWSFQTINGYFFSPYFSLGIAIGLDGYHQPSFNTMPLLLDVRYYLQDEENSFFTFLDIGPAIRIGGDNSEFRKAMVFNIGLGYKFKASNKIYLISELSYNHKTVSLTDEWIRTLDYIIKANGIGLSLGIIF